MATLDRAIEIAVKAHSGQVDKAGEPYILHPIRVMLRVNGVDARIVAILHDVVEDSEFTIDDLRNEGFSEAVLEAISALTKGKGESRVDAALRAASNDIARLVKLADNFENMDLSRIKNPTIEDYKRIKEYQEVRKILLNNGKNATNRSRRRRCAPRLNSGVWNVKRLLRIFAVALLGAGIVVVGFVYDILFAGIPYQDPTPELQADYNFHSSVAGMLYKTGGIVMLLGLLAAPFLWRRSNRRCRLSPGDDSVSSSPRQ